MSVGPRVPPEVCGLLRAIECSLAGNETYLDAWYRTKRVSLGRTLYSWTRKSQSADEILQAILIAALHASRARTTVKNEAGWMSRVAANTLADIRREDRLRRCQSHELCDLPDESSLADPFRVIAAKDALCRMIIIAATFGSPEREALLLRLKYRWDQGEIDLWLTNWLGIGKDRARKIRRSGRKLLRKVVSGKCAGRVGPRHRVLTPPPPVFLTNTTVKPRPHETPKSRQIAEAANQRRKGWESPSSLYCSPHCSTCASLRSPSRLRRRNAPGLGKTARVPWTNSAVVPPTKTGAAPLHASRASVSRTVRVATRWSGQRLWIILIPTRTALTRCFPTRYLP